MVHPDVPGVLLTPICAHMLAAKPYLFPDSVTLRLQVCHSFSSLFPLCLSLSVSLSVSLAFSFSFSLKRELSHTFIPEKLYERVEV